MEKRRVLVEYDGKLYLTYIDPREEGFRVAKSRWLREFANRKDWSEGKISPNRYSIHVDLNGILAELNSESFSHIKKDETIVIKEIVHHSLKKYEEPAY